MHKTKGMILEIFSQKNRLKMSLSQRDESPPSLKTYSECRIEPATIEDLSREIINLLNKQDRKSHIGNEAYAELKKTGQLLYDHLLTRTVKERLGNESGLDLVLTLDEKLIFLPWELLFDGKEFLCLKFNLGRSIRTEKEIRPYNYRNISFPFKMLIIANPSGDLKSSYQEGLEIKNYLGKAQKTFIVNFKAEQVDTLYVKKNLRDYDIVHFAGHCEFDSANPSENGWLLSDGKIKTRDFLLMAETQPLPSIIFANACQSAKTEVPVIDFRHQKYIYNFAYAFLFSGVRHYIGSSWRIDDHLGFDFAREFYIQVIAGKGIGQAIRLARITLINKYGNDALAWGSYILYGDPSFVLSESPAQTAVPSEKKKKGYKKKIKVTVLSLLVTIAFLIFYNFLTVFQPVTYFLFSRAQRFFIKGKNQKVINISQQLIKDDAFFLPAYRMLGDIYFRLGDISSALNYYFDYLRFSEKKKDNKSLANAYLKIAWAYQMKGDYPRAEEFYSKAIELSRQCNDKLNEADALSRLAVWYTDKENFEKAFSLLTQSSEINRQREGVAEHKFNLGCDYFNLAYIFSEKNNYLAAKEFYLKSLKIFSSLKAIPELSDYYFNMGEIALFEKKYQQALDYYAKGLELDKKLNHLFNLSSDYQMIAELYVEMGKFAEAERNFREAISLSKQTNNLPVLASVYYRLGLMYRQKGDRACAKDFLRSSLQIYKDIDTPDYQKIRQIYLSLE